jgi:hypothetical protein
MVWRYLKPGITAEVGTAKMPEEAWGPPPACRLGMTFRTFDWRRTEGEFDLEGGDADGGVVDAAAGVVRQRGEEAFGQQIVDDQLNGNGVRLAGHGLRRVKRCTQGV